MAFPLNVPGGVIRVDLGEALVEPERNQLPGSYRDFIGAHSVVDISNADAGRVDRDARRPAHRARRHHRRAARTIAARAAGGSGTAAGTTVYAYLFNNYWHTNYKAYQQGPLTYRFVLRPHAAFDALGLRRFSDEQDTRCWCSPSIPRRPTRRRPSRWPAIR